MSEVQLPQTSLELKDFFNNEEFVIKTCQQINKDLVGLIENPLSFNLDFERDILDQLVKVLTENLKKMNSHNVLQFSYKVDLKELEFESNLNRNLGFEDLAFKVIRREAQKVFLRIKYS